MIKSKGIYLLFFLLSICASIFLIPITDVFATGIPNPENTDSLKGVTDCATVTQIPQTECEALRVFYSSTNGDSWTDKTGWLVTNTPCSWYGIECTAGSVSSINFIGNNLSGVLPPEIGNFPNLTLLQLYATAISGPIPSEIGNLTNLSTIILTQNDFSGSIPPQLGNLSNLKRLDISDNLVSGNIPSELGNLSNLEILNLSYEQLSGTIPVSIWGLSNLLRLNISGTEISGSIPASIASLSKIKVISLTNNQLSGEIPEEIGSLSSLEGLGLRLNDLSGNIPSTIGSLNHLTSLDLVGNQLTGNIPPELGLLVNLEYLGLDYNQLSGSIPAELGNLANLTQLSFYSNQLSGNLPPELGNLVNLFYLNFSRNAFSGSIPQSFTNLANIVYFYYDETNLCAPTDPAFQLWLSSVTYLSDTWNCLAAPTKTNPKNNGFTNDTTPTFTWQKQMDGEKYQILVDNDTDFSSPVLQASGIVNPTKTFTTALGQGLFYWKVRAKDPGGNWSPWSTNWKFTVDTTPPGKPVLLSPANGSKTSDRTPTFTWKALTGAKYYQLVVDDNSDFSSPVYKSPWLTVTNRTLTTSLSPKLYYWKVVAKDAAGNMGAWSLAWKVTIK